MTNQPQPPGRPPEIQVIIDCRDAEDLSKGAAAKAAGISDTYWSMIENGERVMKGRRGLRTLAKMARAVGVPPGAMEAAGRPDIESELAAVRLAEARSLEEAQEAADRMVATMPGLPARQREALRERVTEVVREVREQGLGRGGL